MNISKHIIAAAIVSLAALSLPANAAQSHSQPADKYGKLVSITQIEVAGKPAEKLVVKFDKGGTETVTQGYLGTLDKGDPVRVTTEESHRYVYPANI